MILSYIPQRTHLSVASGVCFAVLTMSSETKNFILYIAMSLDGYISEKGGGVKFLDKYEHADCGYKQFISNIHTCIMGRVTFEQVLDFPVPWLYPDQKCYILTRNGTKRDLPPNAVTHPGPISDLVQQLREDPNTGKDIWVIGGAKIVHEMLDINAIDVLEVYVIPELLGDGIRLFEPSKYSDVPLTLVEAKTCDMGIQKLKYRVEHPK